MAVMSPKLELKFTKGQRVRYIAEGHGCRAEVGKEYIIGFVGLTDYKLYDITTGKPINAPYCKGCQLQAVGTYKDFKYPIRVPKIRIK